MPLFLNYPVTICRIKKTHTRGMGQFGSEVWGWAGNVMLRLFVLVQSESVR
jgi:hypothetical protein